MDKTDAIVFALIAALCCGPAIVMSIIAAEPLLIIASICIAVVVILLTLWAAP